MVICHSFLDSDNSDERFLNNAQDSCLTDFEKQHFRSLMLKRVHIDSDEASCAIERCRNIDDDFLDVSHRLLIINNTIRRFIQDDLRMGLEEPRHSTVELKQRGRAYREVELLIRADINLLYDLFATFRRDDHSDSDPVPEASTPPGLSVDTTPLSPDPSFVGEQITDRFILVS